MLKEVNGRRKRKGGSFSSTYSMVIPHNLARYWPTNGHETEIIRLQVSGVIIMTNRAFTVAKAFKNFSP